MPIETWYIRHEPTSYDTSTYKGTYKLTDIVIYKHKNCTQRVGAYPWWCGSDKPRFGCKKVRLNGNDWPVTWLPPKTDDKK